MHGKENSKNCFPCIPSWMGRGDHPKTFLLKALCCQITPSWLKLKVVDVGGLGGSRLKHLITTPYDFMLRPLELVRMKDFKKFLFESLWYSKFNKGKRNEF